MELLNFNSSASKKDFQIKEPHIYPSTKVSINEIVQFQSSVGLPRSEVTKTPLQNTALMSLVLRYELESNIGLSLIFKTVSKSLLNYSGSHNRDEILNEFINKAYEALVLKFTQFKDKSRFHNHVPSQLDNQIRSQIRDQLIKSLEDGFLR